MAYQREKPVNRLQLKYGCQNDGGEPNQRTGDQNEVSSASHHFSLTIVARHRL
jgi:hypothetical protein